MKSQGLNKDLLLGLIILLWLLGVFTAYMVTHKPFTPEQFLNILLVLWRVAMPFILTALAGGLGMLAKADKLSAPPHITAALAAGLGFGILALYALAWGALVAVNISIFIFPFIALILFRKNISAWLKLWMPDPKQISLWSESSWVGKFILTTIAVLLAQRLVAALAPPLEFDSLTYHFAIPQAYLLAGKIHYIPELMFWGMPQLNEMLYMLAMLTGGVESAAVVSWLIGVLALLGLMDFARAHYGADAALLTGACLMSGLTLVIALGSGYVEWASLLYGLAMIVALIKWLENNARHNLIFAGIFAGLALSTKYTSGIALLTGLTIILAFKRPLKAGIFSAFILGALAVVTFAPWLAKNALATGNPVYPLIFATRDFDAARMMFYNFAPPVRDWSRLVLLPWLATIMGVDGREGYSASIGALMLSFSPLAFLFWGRLNPAQRRITLIALTMLLAGMVVWAFGSQVRGLLIQSRLFVAIFPAWALIAAAGFSALLGLKAANVRFGNIASALVALSMLFVVYETGLITTASGMAGAVLGTQDWDTYLRNNFGEFSNAMHALQELPAGSRVLMLWETRGFYCEPVCDSDEIIDRWFHDWRTNGSLDAVRVQWHAQGYTHLLLRVDGMDFVKTEDKNAPYLPADWEALDGLLATLKIEEKFGTSYILYSLGE